MGFNHHGSSLKNDLSRLNTGVEREPSRMEAERTLIAQELHDTLLQGFLALSLQLHDAVDRLPDDVAAKARFRDLARLCERALQEGRQAVQGLRAPMPPHRSLGHALANIPVELGLPSGVDFRVVVEGKQQILKTTMRDEIYRIGREAVVNAYRHARAGSIEIAIEYRSSELRLAVRDNGCGIERETLQPGKNGHWGIQGMRERAERIGARLRIMSRVALGTEVELSVPARLAFEQA